MALDPSYEYELDIFGQQPDLHNLYTQISLIYSLPSSIPISETRVDSNDNTDDPDLLVSALSHQLTTALQRLTTSIPWLAGQVVHDQAHGKKYKIVPIPLSPTPHLTIKDLRRTNEHLTMKAMREAKFPMSMLDENVVAPRNTLMATGEVCPVFLVQATIVPSGCEGGEERSSVREGGQDQAGEGDGKDGLILTFVALHNVVDMTGLGWIIGLLDRLAKGGEMTSEEIQLANLDRRGFIKTLDVDVVFQANATAGSASASEDVHAQAEAEAKVQEGSSSSQPQPEEIATPSSSLRWAYILFPPASLAEMKALSLSHNTAQGSNSNSNTQTSTSFPTFVSTDDVLSAFIFQSIIRARIPRLNLNLKQNATFARAVDPRRFLGIHPSYPGVVQCMTYTSYPLLDVADMPLGRVAADLRGALTARSTTPVPTSTSTFTTPPPGSTTPPSSTSGRNDIAYRTRLLATQISHSIMISSSGLSPPPPLPSVTSSLDLTRDVMLSSWANQSSLWTFDFGLGLGTPESVRRPAFVGVESLCYVMPRRKMMDGEGEAVVALCLRDEDIQRMRADERVKKWGVWVG